MKALVFLGCLGAGLGRPYEAAAGVAPALAVGGDAIGLVEVPSSTAGSQLAVFVADHAKPKRQRSVTWVAKKAKSLTITRKDSLWTDVAGYDVCRLSRQDKAGTLLFLREGGVYRLGDKKPFVRADTLFIHSRGDALPRVRICFDLFAGEPPALVVPILAGVDVYRAGPGGSYTRHARLKVEAEPRYQWQNLRGDDLERIQRVSMRLEYPDVTAPDFDHDGRPDLCFNLGEMLTCHFQDAEGFASGRQRRFSFDLLTDAERKDTSIRVESDLIDLNNDGLPDLVLQRTNWNLSDMGTSLFVFLQEKGGGFAGKPVQTVARKGYFAFQEYMDLDGDGFKDLVAPVAALGWSDLAGIYLSKSVDVDFVWYRNNRGHFEAAKKLHSFSFPVEFKNMAAILGGLPLWDAKLLPSKAGERQITYFPGKNAVDVFGWSAAKGETRLWKTAAPVGAEVLAIDLDGDGLNEIVFSYGREPERAGQLVMVEAGG